MMNLDMFCRTVCCCTLCISFVFLPGVVHLMETSLPLEIMLDLLPFLVLYLFANEILYPFNHLLTTI